MPDIYQLPPNWPDIDTSRRLIAEGWYTVRVAEIASPAANRIEVVFEILDEGEHLGWSIYETFTTDNENGVKAFKKFVEAVDVETPNLTIDLAACKAKVLRVRVRQKTDENGETWANVIAHARDRG